MYPQPNQKSTQQPQYNFFTPMQAPQQQSAVPPTVMQPPSTGAPQFFQPNTAPSNQPPTSYGFFQPASQNQFSQPPVQTFTPPTLGQFNAPPTQIAPPPTNMGAVQQPTTTPSTQIAPPPVMFNPAQQTQAPLPPPPSDDDFEGGSLKPQKLQQQTQDYSAPTHQSTPFYPQNQGTMPPQGYPPQMYPPQQGYPQQYPQTYQPPTSLPVPPQTMGPPPSTTSNIDDIDSQMAKLSVSSQQFQAYNNASVTTGSDNLPRPTSLSFGYDIPQPDVLPLFERKNTLSKVDMSKAQSSTRFIRPTIQVVPNAPALLNKWVLPFGAVIQPFAEGEQVPVVNMGSAGIIRCYQCRTYINPFCVFIEGGRKWQCNICKKLNDVSSEYYCQLDEYGQRKDFAKRPELQFGTVDFIAPQEYMARVPQPPAYLFAIDVSYPAIANGSLKVITQSIKQILDKLPGDVRTRVGFITYDSTIHFYNLKPSLTLPQMLVVGDLTESLLPIPTDLLANLDESRHVVDALLDRLPAMFAKNTNVDSCLGAVLNSAGRILGRVGGKLVVFMSNIPTLGPNSLKNREDNNMAIYGSENEKQLLNPATPNYKELALVYSRDQVCVDFFITAEQYVDVASLSALPKYTGGQISYYPGFKADNDGEKLRNEIQRVLCRETAFEAVMRVRVSNGLKITNFYGNFFIRSHDLLALPNVDSDKAFGIEFAHTATFVATPNASIQSAVLYTSSSGERRIRVNNVTLPITSSLPDMFKFADLEATANLLGKILADDAPRVGPTAARNKLRDMVVNCLRSYRENVSKQGAAQLVLPDSLRLLPLYACALAKNECLLGGNEIRADERVAALQRMTVASVLKSSLYIHPTMYAVHEFAEQPSDTLPVKLVPLSRQAFVDHGVYLLDDGMDLYLWIGKSVAADTDALDDIIKAVQYANNQAQEEVTTSLGQAILKLVELTRQRSGYLSVRLVTGEVLKKFSIRKMVEDKTIAVTMSYDEFLRHVHQQLSVY